MSSSGKQLAPWSFKPGQSGNPSGRSKKLLNRIDEMCHANGRHPYTELMIILPNLSFRDQAEVWLQLLSYIQPKPKEPLDDKESPTSPEEIGKLSMNELLTLVKPFTPTDPVK